MPPTRASPRVTATISAALSPPEPKHLAPRPSPAPTAATGLFQFQFAQLDRCGDDTSKTRVSLRSTAPALLLQSPVQRAGRAIGFADAERHAAARNCRRERSLLMLTFYIRRAPPPGVEFASVGDGHIAARFAPVAPHGELQTLGEHGLLCGESGHTRATGHPFAYPQDL